MENHPSKKDKETDHTLSENMAEEDQGSSYQIKDGKISSMDGRPVSMEVLLLEYNKMKDTLQQERQKTLEWSRQKQEEWQSSIEVVTMEFQRQKAHSKLVIGILLLGVVFSILIASYIYMRHQRQVKLREAAEHARLIEEEKRIEAEKKIAKIESEKEQYILEYAKKETEERLKLENKMQIELEREKQKMTEEFNKRKEELLPDQQKNQEELKRLEAEKAILMQQMEERLKATKEAEAARIEKELREDFNRQSKRLEEELRQAREHIKGTQPTPPVETTPVKPVKIELSDFARETENLLEKSRSINKNLKDAEKFLLEKRDESTQLFNQLMVKKEILGDTGVKAEERLLITKAVLDRIQDKDISATRALEQGCQQIDQELSSFLKVLQEKQAALLYANYKSVDALREDMSDAEKKHRQLQKNIGGMLENIEKKYKNFKNNKQLAYGEVLGYYQKSTLNNNTFGKVYIQQQNIQDRHQNINALMQKSGQFYHKTDLEKKQNQLTQQKDIIKNKYHEFIEYITDPVIVEGLERISLDATEQKNDQRIILQNQMDKDDKAINLIMQEMDKIQAEIEDISKYYTTTQNSMERAIQENEKKLKEKQVKEQETRMQSQETVKKATPISSDNTEKTPVQTAKKILFDKYQLDQILNTTDSYFDFAPAEFIIKSSTFSEKDNKLVLKSYSIHQVQCQVYNEGPERLRCLLVRTLAPQDNSGDCILRRDNVYWYYSKRYDYITRITPQQQLDQALNIVDLIEIAVLKISQYEPDQYVEEILGQETLYRIKLQKANARIPLIYYQYSPTKKIPLKFEYFDQSGKCRVMLYCRSFQSTSLGMRVQKYVIVDLNTDLLLQMEYLNVEKKTFPEYIFRSTNLKEIK